MTPERLKEIEDIIECRKGPAIVSIGAEVRELIAEVKRLQKAACARCGDHRFDELCPECESIVRKARSGE